MLHKFSHAGCVTYTYGGDTFNLHTYTYNGNTALFDPLAKGDCFFGSIKCIGKNDYSVIIVWIEHIIDVKFTLHPLHTGTV